MPFVFSDDLQDVRTRLARIERVLMTNSRAIVEILELMAMSQADIDNLRAAVARNTSAVDSARALLASLAQTIRDAADDPEELKKLADDLDAKTNELAQAVVDNTPAATT